MERKKSSFVYKSFKRYGKMPLYYNALYLIVGNLMGALLGFVFWVVAARFYPTEVVGVASAAIAALGMLGTLSHMGFGLGLIRFLPGSGNRASAMINSCLTIATDGIGTDVVHISSRT